MEEMKPTPPATRETIIDRLGKLCQEAAREGVVNPEYDTILDPFCRRVNAVAAEAASTLAAMREDLKLLGWFAHEILTSMPDEVSIDKDGDLAKAIARAKETP